MLFNRLDLCELFALLLLLLALVSLKRKKKKKKKKKRISSPTAVIFVIRVNTIQIQVKFLYTSVPA